VAACQYFSCNFSNFTGNADADLTRPPALNLGQCAAWGSSVTAKTRISRPAESLRFAGATDEALARDAVSLSRIGLTAGVGRGVECRRSVPLLRLQQASGEESP